MQRITGLPEEQVLAYEARAEAALRAALESVMDTIARRIERSAPVLASVLVAADGGDEIPADSVPEGDGLPPGQPYVSPDDLTSIPPLWQEAVTQQILPIVAQVFMDAAGRTHANMVDASSIVTLPSVGSLAAEQYLAQAQNTFDQVGDSLWATARNELSAGFEQGESIPQLAERLRASAGMTARTGVLVARTQVNEASNAGSFEVARASGLQMRKVWFATNDLRTRVAHLEVEAETERNPIPLNEPFIVGGESAMFPAAPTLSPAMRYNCRCAIGYVMLDKAPAEVRADDFQTQQLADLPGTSEVAPAGEVFPTQAAPTGPGFDQPARGEQPMRYVRPSLKDAKTPRQLRKAWQDEAQALTGFPFVVDAMPRGISMVTAREYAEGTLQMLAQFPGAKVDRIHWFEDMASSSYAQVRRGGHAIEFNMRYASETGRPGFLAARRRDAGGWDAGTTSWGVRNDVDGQGVIYHEFTHILDIENGREAIHGQIVPLLIQHAQREGITDIDDLIKRQISSYATKNYQEMIAEAGADVMVNGAAASQLSRDIFDLLRAEYRRRGFEIRTAPAALEDFGEAFPKIAAPKPIASMTVADLRAELTARGVAIPAKARKADLVKALEEAPATVPGEALETVDEFATRTNQIKGATPAARKLRASVDAELRRQFDLAPYAMSTEIRGVRVATPDEWAELGRRGIVREERTHAAYSLNDREIIFSPQWRTAEGVKGARRQFETDHLGWSFPEYDVATADYAAGVLRHEIGHAVSRRFPTVERRTAEGDILSQEWTTGQRDRFIGPLADELRIRRPGPGESIDDWWAESATQGAARKRISGYAGEANIQEAMAEIWASYSGRGELASKLTQRIGKAMADEWPSPAVAARVVQAPLEGIAARPAAAITRARGVEAPVSRAPLAIQARQAQLREAAARPVVEGTSRRQSGENAYTTRVEHEGGPPTISKDFSRLGEGPAASKRRADAEELGALVSDASGIRAPAVIRTGPRSVEMEFIEGQPGDEFLQWGQSASDVGLTTTDDGRLLGLADILMGNTDRNAGNFIRMADGHLAAVDHEGAFGAAKLAGASDRFGADLVGREAFRDVKWPKSIDINPADLAVIKARLEALRPEFERLGRATWHRQVMARLAEVEKRADPNAAIRLAEARPDLAAIKAESAAPTTVTPLTPFAGRARALRRLLEDPKVLTEPLGGGHISTADVVTTSRGEKYVIKSSVPREGAEFVSFSGRTPSVLTDNEVLGSEVFDAVGARAPAVVRLSDQRTAQEFVEGRSGVQVALGKSKIETNAEQRLVNETSARLAATDEGKLRGLAEVLIQNGDSNADNWFMDEGGHLWSIDHGGANFSHDSYYGVSNAWTRQFLDRAKRDGSFAAHGISPADMAIIRVRLAALEPKFAELGRKDWFDQVMRRVDALSEKAEGTRSILAPVMPAADRAARRAAARAQAATIATQRGNAALIARIDELVQAKASKAVIRQELDPALREAEQLYAGATSEVADALQAAVDSGDTAKIRAALTRQSKANGLTPIGKAGAKAKFDPATMEGVGGTAIPDGADVIIVRRGAKLAGIETPEKAAVRLVVKPAPPAGTTPAQFNVRIKVATKGQEALDAAQAGVRYVPAREPGELGQTVWRGIDDEDVRTALDGYVGNDFDIVNGALRQVRQRDQDVRLGRALVSDLDRAFDQSHLTRDIELWRSPGSGRGIFGDPDTWGEDLAGFEWSDSAYSSATASKRVADRFTKDGGVRLRILTPKGSKVIQLSEMPVGRANTEEEAEMLLARGARFRVVKDRGWKEITHPTTHQKIRVRDLDVEVFVPDETPPLPWATN